MILEGYLKPQQLAQQLDISVRTLYRWNVRRIGPPRVVIARQIFYRHASVMTWLASREQRRKARLGINPLQPSRVQKHAEGRKRLVVHLAVPRGQTTVFHFAL